MLRRRDPAAIFLVAGLAACKPGQAPTPETRTAEPTPESPCAASIAAAGACTGSQLELEMCSVFTSSTVFAEIANNTDKDLVFDVGMTIVDPRGEELRAAVLGPEVRVAARATSRSWQIAMPPLPDGYVRIEVMALGKDAGGEREYITTSAGQLRVTGGKVEVLDVHAWDAATSHLTVTEAPP